MSIQPLNFISHLLAEIEQNFDIVISLDINKATQLVTPTSEMKIK